MSLYNSDNTLNVEEFDKLILDALNPKSITKNQSEKQLMEFREESESWRYVDTILKNTKQRQSALYALMILDDVVKTKWLAFENDQKDNIKSYVVQLIISTYSDDKIIVNKLNHILIQILKMEWPNRWSTFIPEIINTANTDVKFCKNTLEILRILIDELSFSEMTTVKYLHLIKHLEKEFPIILNLIQLIFQSNDDIKMNLIQPTFLTLRSVLQIIPEPFIFESEIIEGVLYNLNMAPYEALDCLFLIVKKNILKMNNENCRCLDNNLCFHQLKSSNEIKITKINFIHKSAIKYFELYFSSNRNLKSQYQILSENEKNFIKIVAYFLSAIYENNLSFLEFEDIKNGINYLLEISKIDDHEIFKPVLNFWQYFLENLYLENNNSELTNENKMINFYKNIKKNQTILEKLLVILVYKMPRPEEVLILENEYGEIIKEKMTDTEMITHINIMKNTINLLCSIIPNEAQTFLLRDLNNTDDIDRLNKVGWTIGAIHSLIETTENDFYVNCLKSLLNICGLKVEKNDKAILASLIIYVISQYTKFLKNNKKFFITVIFKILEFMNEEYEGIQDMACEAFDAISKSCYKEFYTEKIKGNIIIIHILEEITSITEKLKFYQKRQFYKSLCFIVQSKYKSLKFADNYLKNMNQKDVELLILYLKKENLNMESNIKLISHVIKSYAILYTVFPMALEYFKPEIIDYYYEFTNKINDNLKIKTNEYLNLRSDFIELFISILKSIKKINDVPNEISVEIKDFYITESFKLIADFKITREYLLLFLAAEVVNISSNISVDEFILKNIFPFILDIKEDDITKGYLKLINVCIRKRFPTFFPLIFSDKNIFENTYNNLLFSLAMKEDIREISLKILIEIFQKSYELRNWMFLKEYFLLTFDNVIGIVFDGGYELACELLILMLQYPYINELNIREYLNELLLSFTNIPDEYKSIFVKGFFILFKNKKIFHAHIEDFRKRIRIIENKDEIQDEEYLLEFRMSMIENK